jgi:hypothetical protein
MHNPAKSPTPTIATIALTSGARRELVLPARLWAEGLHVGDRVVVTTDEGETYAPLEVQCGAHDEPIVILPVRPDAGATRAFVRRAPMAVAA